MISGETKFIDALRLLANQMRRFGVISMEMQDEEDLVVAHLLNFFEHNIQKTMLWLETPNPLLGQLVPATLLVLRRPGTQKVLKFVETQLAENER